MVLGHSGTPLQDIARQTLGGKHAPKQREADARGTEDGGEEMKVVEEEDPTAAAAAAAAARLQLLADTLEW